MRRYPKMEVGGKIYSMLDEEAYINKVRMNMDKAIEQGAPITFRRAGERRQFFLNMRKIYATGNRVKFL